jgi:uncharacterized protein (TIGR00251 family)
VQVTVRVRPGARVTAVGGRYGTGEPAVLTVSVRAPAADGRANDAVVAAMAEAFGVQRGSVSILRGARSRTKVVEVAGGDAHVLEALLAR